MPIILKNKDGVLLKTAGKYCPEDITVVPQLQEKTVTSNGKVTPDANYAGLSGVTVNVPSKEEETKTVDLAMASGNQTINPTNGKTLSQVVVKKPATMIPENIKKDVNIGGVTGTLEIGGGGELNIAYGDTAPEDTSKLWIKSEEPSNISFPVVWKPEQVVNGLIDVGKVLPKAAYDIGVAAVGTKIYLFGGNGSSMSDTIQVFDTTNNTIQTLSTKLPTTTYGIDTAVVGTKIYLIGGTYLLDKVLVFDTTNNTIQTLPITLPHSMGSCGVAAVGTKIYLFGGTNTINMIQVFDTTNNTIQTLSTKLPDGVTHIAAAAVGAKVYLFGGYVGSRSALNKIQVFDTGTNTIKTLSAKLSTEEYYIAAAAVGAKVYLFGGLNWSDSKLNKIQVFDTTNNTIQTLSTKLPEAAYGIGTAAVGTKIYLFGGLGSSYLNTINQFTVNVPLSSNDIIVTQEYYDRTFKVLKAPTEVEVAVKYVYKGDQNLAKFIDAYLYDGANWVNVNTGNFTFTKLYAPKISISGKTLTITNDGRNGSKVTNYKVYNGSTLLTTVTATTLDLTTVITANGTYNISVIATGTGYTDSDSSNVVEYNYAVYNITTNLTGVEANASNPTTVSTLASSTLTFTANTGYNLPDNVTVTGAEHTWTKSSATLVLSNPTGTVSVTVAGVAISYTITPTLNNVTAASGNATTIATGETKVLTYTAESGYTLPDPDSVTVTGATGVWNKDAGTLTLSNPTGNVTFTIAGVEVVRGYTVTLNNGDVPVPFSYYINENASVLVGGSSLPLVLNNVYRIKLEINATGNYLTNTTGSLVGHENDIFGNYVNITEDSSANVYTDQ